MDQFSAHQGNYNNNARYYPANQQDNYGDYLTRLSSSNEMPHQGRRFEYYQQQQQQQQHLQQQQQHLQQQYKPYNVYEYNNYDDSYRKKGDSATFYPKFNPESARQNEVRWVCQLCAREFHTEYDMNIHLPNCNWNQTRNETSQEEISPPLKYSKSKSLYSLSNVNAVTPIYESIDHPIKAASIRSLTPPPDTSAYVRLVWFKEQATLETEVQLVFDTADSAPISLQWTDNSHIPTGNACFSKECFLKVGIYTASLNVPDTGLFAPLHPFSVDIPKTEALQEIELKVNLNNIANNNQNEKKRNKMKFFEFFKKDSNQEPNDIVAITDLEPNDAEFNFNKIDEEANIKQAETKKDKQSKKKNSLQEKVDNLTKKKNELKLSNKKQFDEIKELEKQLTEERKTIKYLKQVHSDEIKNLAKFAEQQNIFISSAKHELTESEKKIEKNIIQHDQAVFELNNTVNQLVGENKTFELIATAEANKYSDLNKEIRLKDKELSKYKQLYENSENTLKEWKTSYTDTVLKLEKVSNEKINLMHQLKEYRKSSKTSDNIEDINNKSIVSNQLISAIKTFNEKQINQGFAVPDQLKQCMNDPQMLIDNFLTGYTALVARVPELELNYKQISEKYESLQDNYRIQGKELEDEIKVNKIQKLQLEKKEDKLSEYYLEIIKSKQTKIDTLKTSMVQLEASKTQYEVENAGLAMKVSKLTTELDKLETKLTAGRQLSNSTSTIL